MVMPHLGDPHPRVRWSACTTLGQMFTDFGPSIQNDFHAKVLPGLMAVMDDKANPRYVPVSFRFVCACALVTRPLERDSCTALCHRVELNGSF